MSTFGSTLFNGSRFIFWSLGPISLLCGLACVAAAPFAFASRDWKAAIALSVLGVCGVCFFLALLNGRRFSWAARVVTGLVALSFVLYFVATYFLEEQQFSPSAHRSEATPWNAVMGFLVIGVPCLWFTIRGRFDSAEEANKAPEPTTTSVTPPAAQEPRQP